MDNELILMVALLLSLSLLGLFSKSTTKDEMLVGESVLRKSFLFNIDNKLENFTIIVLPDTQYYSEKYPWIFDNQTRWVVENIEKLNIVFVSHLGDLVQNWDSINEWENANRSMSVLDGNVPWGVLPGNHDGFYGNLTNYNNYFAYERFSDESWYGGAYQSNNTNSYQLFQGGNNDYLIFHLQYMPTQNMLSWASDVIDRYPGTKVIVTIHDYLHSSSDSQQSEIGETVWQKLIKPHASQVFLVLCGHSFWYNDERAIIETVNGNVVYQLLANYQNRTNGGNGWLRILEFSPRNKKIFVKTYSPYLNKFETDTNSQFVLDYDIPDSNDGLTHLQFFSAFVIIGGGFVFIILFLRKRGKKITKCIGQIQRILFRLHDTFSCRISVLSFSPA